MTRTNFGTDVMRPGQQPPGMVPSYSTGGAIDEDTGETNPMMDSMGARLQVDINSALGIVNNVLSYGRKLHGLGGDDDQQQAGVIPSQPFSETPKPQPMPGPLPPTSNPFGRRNGPARMSENEADGDEDDGAIPMQQMAGVLPAVPFSQTPRPQPMPGPLPPTSNPFGKRAEAEPEQEEPDPAGAIDTEETA